MATGHIRQVLAYYRFICMKNQLGGMNVAAWQVGA